MTVLTPGGPYKAKRRPDIVFQNRKTGKLYFENIGRKGADGKPVPREQRALDDLATVPNTRKPQFTAYN